MNEYVGTVYRSLLNEVITYADSINLAGNDPSSVPYIDASQNLADYVFTNGQLLIGSTGNNPAAGQIQPTTNQTTVINSAGSIQIGAAQDIDPSSSPTFANITDSGVSDALLCTITGGLLQPCVISNNNGTNTSYAAGTLSLSMNQNLNTTGNVTFNSITDSSVTNTLLNAGSGGLLGATTITNANGTNASYGSGSLDFSMTQNLATNGNPTFQSVALSTLGTFELVSTDGSKKLQSVNITNTNGNNLSFSGTTLTASLSQDLRTTAVPSFVGVNGNGLLQYSVGTVSQVGTTITGAGFTSAMVGGIMIPSAGSAVMIQTFNSSTSLTAYVAQTISPACSFVIFYSFTNPGFALGPNGDLLLRTLSSSGSATSGVTLQLLPAGPGASYNIDVSTYNPLATPCNGRMQFTDNSFGADYSYWSKIQGSDTNALQKLFSISADTSVTTFNNTLDTNGSANFIGTVTTGNIIDSGLTATRLAATDGSKQLQSVTIANSNGSNGSFTGSTLTLSNSQDLQTSATPTFANIIDSGLTATRLTATNASKQLESVTIANSNGSNGSFTGSTLTLSNSQDVSTTGTVTFASITNSGMGPQQLVCTNTFSKYVGCGLASSTGCVLSVAANALSVDTPQDLRTSASPAFTGLSVTSNFFYPSKINTAYSSSTTILTADLLSRFIQCTAAVSGITLTFPTGTVLETAIAAIATPYIGMSWDVLFWNFNSNSVALNSATGFSFQIMNTTQSGSTARLYRIIRTSTNNYTIYNLS